MQLRTVIIRPGALGDTLVTLPALAELKAGADVFFVGREPGLSFLTGHVAAVFDFELSGWHGLFSAAAPNIRSAVSSPDIVAAFLADREGRVRRNLSLLYARAEVRVFPSLPDEGRSGHVARYLAECLADAGLMLNPDRVLTRCREGALLDGGGNPETRRKLVLHPGSGGIAKNHPIEFWVGLLERMRKEPDFSALETLVLAGPAEIDVLPEWKREFRGKGVTFVVSADHVKLGRIMKTAKLYVGHDSGITHLAALCGAPTVALFRAGRPDRWRPLGPRVRVISSREADAGLEGRVLGAGRVLLAK